MGFPEAIKLNSALMSIGEEIGEPKEAIPVLTITEKGFEESLGRYARLKEGPDSKRVESLRVSSLEVPAAMADWKGRPRMVRGIFALNNGFWSSRNFRDAFIFFV